MSWMRMVMAGLLLACVAAPTRGALTTVSHWRLGEEDPAAAPAGAVRTSMDRSSAARTLKPVGKPVYSDAVDPRLRDHKLSIRFDGQSALRREGLADLADNFVIEAFARAENSDAFRVVVQYGSDAHGWSIVQNKQGFQVLLGGVSLVGWSGDVPAGQWVHLAMVRDNGITRFYIDGRASGKSDAKPNRADARATFSIGADTAGRQGFIGEIDEVRLSTFAAGAFDPRLLMVNDPDGKAASRDTPPDAPAPAGQASIVFDADPVETGMTFRRQSMAAREIAGRTAWQVQHGSADGVPWARSVLITLTDPALREGRQPVVDIEVEYLQEFDAPVELRADTAEGSRVVGSGWGRADRFKTFRARLDTAHFGARSHGNAPDKLQTDGYDLRINSFGGDFYIRSIKLTAFDLRDKPDLSRVVRFDGVFAPDELLLFAPGSTSSVDYRFSNLAFKPAELKYRHELTDYTGQMRDEASGTLRIDGRSAGAVRVLIDTRPLALGAYRTRLVITDSAGQTLFEREGGIGVANETPVARARPGEFLFGLDVQLGPAYNSPELLRWARFMGADIIRHGFGWNDSVEEIERYLPVFEQAGLQVMLICDPPKDQQRRAELLPGKIEFLKTVATRFPQIQYYELGNEPDLTYFYPGPIANYVEDFHAMSDAIRAANPSAVVLNGGLSFAGAEGDRRSREFIELVDVERIGAWSYHGHGPGMRAEAMAHNRIRDLVRAQNKLRPFVDTESGVAARTPVQEMVQARTVVQKMVYAQSEQMPFLMFFRLLMREEAYGMLHDVYEPRPAVMAYAHMTRTLRGHRFARTLDGLPDGVYGFVFEGDARGAAVLWSDSSAARQLHLQLTGAASPVQSDLFGNALPIDLPRGGAVAMSIGNDPVYLTWTGNGTLTVRPSSLHVPSRLAVRESGSDALPITLIAPSDRPLKGTLRITPGERAGLRIAQSQMPVDVPAGETRVMSVPVEVERGETNVRWPTQWAAFVDVSTDATVPHDRVPETFAGVAGQTALLINDRIDFERLGGKMREGAVAVVMGEIESVGERTVRVGASADWWMEWSVNGKVVYSTLDAGNGGGYAITDHTFDLPLVAGRNIVSVRVLSGSMGWKLLIGSPQRLAEASTDSAAGGVRFELTQANEPTEVQQSMLTRIAPIQPSTHGQQWTAPEDWQRVQPDVVLLDHVENRFAAEPDASRWWQGASDLSARAWIRHDRDTLRLVIAVADDAHLPAPADDIARGDAIRIKLLDAQSQPRTISVTGTNGNDAAVDSASPAGTTARVTRVEGTTWYELRIDTTGASRPMHLDVVVFDQDASMPSKQQLTLSPPAARGVDGWHRIVWPDGDR